MTRCGRVGVLIFSKCFSAHSLFMQSNMYSRLETSLSLFLALPGIFEARFFSCAPRIPVNSPISVNSLISENPPISENLNILSEVQKGLVSSLHVFRTRQGEKFYLLKAIKH